MKAEAAPVDDRLSKQLAPADRTARLVRVVQQPRARHADRVTVLAQHGRAAIQQPFARRPHRARLAAPSSHEEVAADQTGDRFPSLFRHCRLLEEGRRNQITSDG